MLGSKIDLFGNEWLEVVFDQKNKSYGAYALRRQSASNTVKALFIAGTLFILLFLSPKIMSLIRGNTATDDVYEQKTPVTMQPPPAVNPKTLPPPSVEPPQAKKDIHRFPPPIVVDREVDTDPPQIKELEKADPGQKTIVGDPDGQLVITATTGKGQEQVAAGEDTHVYDQFVPLESQPMFPGGMNKFYAYLSKAIRYPGMAQENGVQGKVFMSFIVEKDGTLSDIKVERKLGSGTDEEAIRVLKASPRWIAGIQNGNPVRVKYNIPISFSLSE